MEDDFPRPQYITYKLVGDPFLNPSLTQRVFRYDGILQGESAPDMELPHDPRSTMHTRFLGRREAADLPIPTFKYDPNYIGVPPEKEVTFSNLNDNISGKNLEDMCRSFGAIEEAKIYYHPKSKKHLGIGKVLFRMTRSARTCAEKLHSTSKMGNIMNVEVDIMGKSRQKLIQNSIQDSDVKHPSTHSFPSTTQQHDDLDSNSSSWQQQRRYSSMETISQTQMSNRGDPSARSSHTSYSSHHHHHSHNQQRQVAQSSSPPTHTRDLESRLDELNLDRLGSHSNSTNLESSASTTEAPRPLRTRRDSSMSSDGKANDSFLTGGGGGPSFLDTNGTSLGVDSGESLEMRIQKLLKGTSLSGGPPDAFSVGESRHPETPAQAPHQDDGTPPPSPPSMAQDFSSPMDQQDSSSYLNQISSDSQHQRMLHSAATPNTGMNEASFANLTYQQQQQLRRKTLLPTPTPPSTAFAPISSTSATSSSYVQLYPPMRPPLLGTPPKPVNDEVVEATMDQVTEKFVAELKDIMKRDITKRMVESNAFRSFYNWWDFEETKSKGIKRYIPKSNPSDTTAGSTETITSLVTVPKEQNGDSTAGGDQTSVTTAGTGTSSATKESNFMGLSAGATMQSLLGLGGIAGMFTGLRGALPKIQRKPRPASPVSRYETEKKNKFKSPNKDHNNDITFEKKIKSDTKPDKKESSGSDDDNNETSDADIGKRSRKSKPKKAANVDDVFKESDMEDSDDASESSANDEEKEEKSSIESDDRSDDSEETEEMTEEESVTAEKPMEEGDEEDEDAEIKEVKKKVKIEVKQEEKKKKSSPQKKSKEADVDVNGNDTVSSLSSDEYESILEEERANKKKKQQESASVKKLPTVPVVKKRIPAGPPSGLVKRRGGGSGGPGRPPTKSQPSVLASKTPEAVETSSSDAGSESDDEKEEDSGSLSEESDASRDGSLEAPGSSSPLSTSKVPPPARKIRATTTKGRGSGRTIDSMPAFVPRGPAKVIAAETDSDEEAFSDARRSYRPEKAIRRRSGPQHPPSGMNNHWQPALPMSSYSSAGSDLDDTKDPRVPPIHGWGDQDDMYDLYPPSTPRGHHQLPNQDSQSRSRRKQQLVNRAVNQGIDKDPLCPDFLDDSSVISGTPRSHNHVPSGGGAPGLTTGSTSQLRGTPSHHVTPPSSGAGGGSGQKRSSGVSDRDRHRKELEKSTGIVMSGSESTDSADAESVDIVETVTAPYNWPANVLEEHNYFSVPQIGSTIKYRSMTNTVHKARENRGSLRESLELSTEQRIDRRISSSSSATIPPHTTSTPGSLDTKERFAVRDITNTNQRSSTAPALPRGNRELASLFTPVVKSSLAPASTAHQQSHANTAATTTPPSALPKTRPATFPKRSLDEVKRLLFTVFYQGMDTEDVRYTKRAYNRLLQSDSREAYWLNDTHWVDHVSTRIVNPDHLAERKGGIIIKQRTSGAGGGLSKEPPKKRRKMVTVGAGGAYKRVEEFDDEDVLPPMHSTGCGRTEGFYKHTLTEKRAAALRCCVRTCIEPESGELVVLGMPLVPAATSESLQKMLTEGQASACGIAGESGIMGGCSGGLATTEKKKKQTQFREARSEQRRLLAEFQDIETGDLLKFNQLKFRKKQLIFAKSHIHNWGLIALEPIAAEEMVIEYVGQVVRKGVAESREKNYEANGIGSSYLFRIDDDYVIDATMCGNNARFINHSCTPNCYAKVITVEGKKKIVIYSKRDIGVMEEITYDYKFPYEEVKIPCLCNSSNCRGTLN